MKKIAIKGISCAISFAMVFSGFSGIACAGTIDSDKEIKEVNVKSVIDIQGHWAQKNIEKAINGGYAKGSDGKFRPDDCITRAEFITLINNVFKYKEKSQSNFSDVSDKAWYQEQVKLAQAAGYANGYEDNTFKPQKNITREEAAVIMAKIIKSEENSNSFVDKFADKNQIASWSRNSIDYMVKKGYLKGYSDNTIKPKKNITRSEALTLIYNAVGTVLDKAGTYGKEEITEDHVLINASGVSLSNQTVEGDLFLSAGIADGDIVLEGVKVNGKTIIEGGGTNTVKISNSQLNEVIVNKANGKIRLLAEGKTEIKETKLLSGAKIEENLNNGAKGFDNVVLDTRRKNQNVELEGEVNQLKVSKETPETTTLQLDDKSVISKLILNDKIKEPKKGTIKLIEKPNQKQENNKKETASSGGSSNHSSNNSSNHSSGGNSSNDNKVEEKIIADVVYQIQEVDKQNKDRKELEATLHAKKYFIRLKDSKDFDRTINKHFNFKENENLFIFKPYEDEKDVLIVYFGNETLEKNKTKNIEVKKLPTLKAGIYKDKEKATLIAGENQTNEMIKSGEYIFAISENGSITSGIEIQENCKYVGGITFKLEETKNEALERGCALTTVVDRFNTLTIENNIFDFGEASKNAVKGIYLTPPNEGSLTIINNKFIGNNEGTEYILNKKGTAAMAIGERPKDNTKILISDNEFSSMKYHGLGLYAGNAGNLEIVNNKFENQGQDAIIMSKFEGTENITIKNNIISNFGIAKVMKKDWITSEEKEIGDFEEGIRIDFIDKAYGILVNDKWAFATNEIVELLEKENKITNKEDNDKNEGVMDSHPVAIGRERNLIHPTVYINKSQYYPKVKDSILIVKNDDMDVTYGRDESEPEEIITIESLTIKGEGSGTVFLPNSLHVVGDLVIDLPNAKLKNNAKVDGETNVISIAGNDSSSADMTIVSGNDFVLGRANLEGLTIKLENIKNSEGQALNSTQSKLSKEGNLQIKVGEQILSTENYSINDEKDEIVIKKSYLDALKESVAIKVSYVDLENNVSKVNSGIININILNSSEADIDITAGNNFYEGFASEEGLVISVKNIKNSAGESISASESKLSDNIKVKRWEDILDASYMVIDDDLDTITLTKEFLNALEGSMYGVNLTVEFGDEDNFITKIEKSISIQILNNSDANFENISGETFIEGNAPIEGMTFKISGLKNSKGEVVNATESTIEGNLEIIPFPVNWSQIDGNNGLKSEFYVVDDEKDTVTLTQAYLNTFKKDDEATYLNITLSEPNHHIFARSEKLPIMLKQAEEKRSETTEIYAKDNSYDINEERPKSIASKEIEINTELKVKDFVKNLERMDAGQTLKVYPKTQMEEETIPDKNLYSYKSGYEKLEQGDVLFVTAEDGVSTELYYITVEEKSNTASNCMSVIDENVITSMTKSTITICEGNVTAGDILDAISLTEGATAKIVMESGDELDRQDKVKATMILIVSVGDEDTQYRIILSGEAQYRALLIGNYDYEGTEMDLDGPQNDLPRLEATMRNSLFGEEVGIEPIVKKENVTKAELLEAISRTFKDAKDNDISYFYYSGHGNRKDDISYLCTLEAESEADWVSVSELEEALSNVPGTKVVILDSCNSGGFIGQTFTKVSASAGINDSEFFNKAVVKVFEENKKALLNGNQYKVLTASAANEYSFESKIEHIGKFTKALTSGCGYENAFLADQDDDKMVSLMEAYQYSEENVSATSHVQVYPYNDNTVIFGNPTGKTIDLSDDVSILSDEFKVVDNGSSRAVMSIDDKTEINNEMTVETFLSHINKGYEKQQLNVHSKNVAGEGSSTEKSGEQKLAKLDKLRVIAENGDEVFYQIFVKEIESEENSEEESGTSSGGELEIPTIIVP